MCVILCFCSFFSFFFCRLLVEKIFAQYLVPHNLETEERMKCLYYLYASLDPNAVKWVYFWVVISAKVYMSFSSSKKEKLRFKERKEKITWVPSCKHCGRFLSVQTHKLLGFTLQYKKQGLSFQTLWNDKEGILGWGWTGDRRGRW